MKPVWKDVLLAIVMGAVVPGLVLNTIVLFRSDQQESPKQNPHQSNIIAQSDGSKEPVTIKVRNGQNVSEIDLEEYLVGVVCAEMPAYFEQEALKAQAVVARTYTLKASVTGGKHGDGSICTDHTCCQAYIDPAVYLGNGASSTDLEKIRSAVGATCGLVLMYEDALIEATYFSCSGGSTEDAAAVWGGEYPYLKATASPGEENAAHYTDTVYISREVLEKNLEITLNENPASWIGYVTYTSGGGVNTAVIGGKEFKGTELRKLLGLKSTAFSAAPDSGGILFTTRGYGHRVGMSQYGADAMAVGGSTFDQILSHYYRGTNLVQWDRN